MIRDAFRAIVRMPGLATVVVLSLGVGIGVEHRGVLVDSDGIAAPVAGRVRGRGSAFHLIEPGGHRHVARRVVVGVSRLQDRVQAIGGLMAFRAPFNVGDRHGSNAYSASSCPATIRRPRAAAGAGRFLPRTEALTRGCPGRRHLVRLLADAFDRASRRRRPDPRQREALSIVGVGAGRVPGNRLGLQYICGCRRRSRRSLLAGSRELQDRAAAGTPSWGDSSRRTERRPSRKPRGDGELAQAYPETNDGQRPRPPVLARRAARRGCSQGLELLQVLMLVLLLAVCGNTANLVLARASGGFAKWASGSRWARPWRIVRLLLVENLLSAWARPLGVLSPRGAATRCERCPDDHAVSRAVSDRPRRTGVGLRRSARGRLGAAVRGGSGHSTGAPTRHRCFAPAARCRCEAVFAAC